MTELARLAFAAAATPGASFARLDPHHAVLAVGPAALVCVPFDRPDGALDALGDALDALSLDDGAAALCALSYDAAWRGASPWPVRDERPPGDRFPAAWLARYEATATLDLATGALTRAGSPAGLRALDDALARADTAPPAARWRFTSATDRAAHRDGVERVREAIRDGEVYLVNLARVLHAEAPPDVDRAVAARVLASEARYGALLRAGDALAGAMSMELALDWDRGLHRAVTRPIKGTRPRRDDPADDAREADALARDPKERAENAMAVDVHRNDLGRVAATGSVTVPALCAVEPHRFVHHLASTVEARVDGATLAREVLRAMLPVGSVTGAPKLAAMAHVARFERERRGLYTGVYGAVTGRRLRLAVAIRTLVRDAAGLHYGAGGGIVWDSDPDREWEELVWKQRAAER
ncbi:MAG: anthranilate synthase component I family protein [Polyangiales bacterium]